jgi:copper transport protein
MAAGSLMRRAVPLALAVAVALGWSAPPPRVHAILEESVPAAADTVAAVPQVMLRFSGPVEEAGAMIHVLGPESRTWMLEVSRQPGDARRLIAAMPTLEPGGYRIAWRVISADGHPIGGDFVFWVGDPADARADLGQPPPSADPMGMGAHTDAPGGPHVSAQLIAVRAAVDLALLPLAGLLLFLAGGPAMLRTHGTIRMLSAAAPLLTATYTWLWAGETLGEAGGPRLDGLLSLTTGRALAAEAVLAALVPWALLLAQRTRLAAAFALLAVGVGGLGGHPASYTPTLSLPASVAHVTAAAIWVGGLAFLVTERGSVTYSLSARRVSSAALWSALVVAATGVLQAVAMVASPAVLLSSGFGLAVLGKVAGFLGLIAIGAYHRYRLVPAVGSSQGAVRLSSSVRYELGLAACVLVVAALLSHIPPTS